MCVKFKGFWFWFVVCCWFGGSVKNVVFFNWSSVTSFNVTRSKVFGVWVISVRARLFVARVPKSVVKVFVGASVGVVSMGEVFAVKRSLVLLPLVRRR